MISHPFQSMLAGLHADLAADRSGAIATYIPELAKADPEHLAIAIVMVDGTRYAVGDADVSFTIQSMSKPFAYAAALDRLGRDGVLARVGVEPTGEAFNAIVLDDVSNRPFNPMVNAGAIAVSALFDGASREARADAMLAALSRFAGRPLAIDDNVFRSEAETGHRNRAIAYLMLNSGMLATDPDTALDTYFRQCSALVTTADLATMAATLANGGVNPLTGERAVSAGHVQDVLTVMLSCGMYDYAGQWAYEVGLPAKSGVSGGVFAVVPGQFGIAAYSPRLDTYGNSVRAVAACRRVSQGYLLHSLRTRADSCGAISRELSGADIRSKRWRTPEEIERLDALGGEIAVIEARGEIFLGAAELILRRVETAMAAGREPILDVRRVTGVDPGAARFFRAFLKAAGEAGQSLILANHAPYGPFVSLVDDPVLAGAVIAAGNLDLALEAAEDRVLRRNGAPPPAATVPLERAFLLSGLDRDEIAALVAAVGPAEGRLRRGDYLARMGEPSDSIFVISDGSVRAELPIAGGAPIRVNGIGPGGTFGEMALLDQAPRSADGVAESDTIYWALPIAALNAHFARHPATANRILSRLAEDLSDRLRRASATIVALGR